MPVEAMVFLGGLIIVVKYMLKDEMYGRFGEIASGSYKRPLSILYLICALALVTLMNGFLWQA